MAISPLGPLHAVPAPPVPAAAEPGFFQVPVIAIVDQTHDIRSFHLARPRGFDFQAGQHLTVAVSVDGQRVSRCFSISSAPESGGYLEISVKRRGLASGVLHSTVGVGSLLSVGPPAGGFIYPAGDDRPLLLLAGGVGCTPLMSMLRHAVVRDPSRPVTYLLSVRTATEIAFRHELALLRRRHPQLRVGVTLTRENRPGLSAGRIDEAFLRRAARDPENSLFYICGPTPMLEEMQRLLAGLGVPASQIRWEVFDNAVAASRAEAAEATRPPTPAPRGVDTAVSDSGHRETSPAGQTLHFPRKEQVEEILRFARGEMMLHWSIAVPFMICFVTGVTMKVFYNLHSESLFREVLSFLHRVGGGALAVFPALAVARNWRDYKVHIYNVKVGFSWTIDDLKWLFLVGPATVSKKIVLPEQRKFNAAERLNFMMVMITYPLFVATGVILWATGVDHFLPWIVHISMSLVAPLLMFGHIYMALVNPSTRVGLSGMFSGRVDREWAKHHYQRWYREHFEEDGTPKARGSADP
jgi:formate dehydrogenase gamma subunit